MPGSIPIGLGEIFTIEKTNTLYDGKLLLVAAASGSCRTDPANPSNISQTNSLCCHDTQTCQYRVSPFCTLISLSRYGYIMQDWSRSHCAAGPIISQKPHSAPPVHTHRRPIPSDMALQQSLSRLPQAPQCQRNPRMINLSQVLSKKK